MRRRSWKKIGSKDQKIKYNINGTNKCQHDKSRGYPSRANQSYDIYACTLDIGHDGDHGLGGWFNTWENTGPNPDVRDLSNVHIYLVGGAVREIVRGNDANIKDWDFAVEAESYDQMREWLVFSGFEIYLETPQYFTIRARAPKNGFSFAGREMGNLTFDFALCRTDGDYSDGRRPDSVEVGTIRTDLSRRDFTMNAIAMDKDGNLIDPFDGEIDITRKLVRCVGSTDRLKEDSLRMLRALRFAVQLEFDLSLNIRNFLLEGENADLLDKISVDRIRDELHKMFKLDTAESFYFISEYTWILRKLVEYGIWFEPTTKGR